MSFEEKSPPRGFDEKGPSVRQDKRRLFGEAVESRGILKRQKPSRKREGFHEKV
jgi:hypothetical protein